jgi:hypothetical protein
MIRLIARILLLVLLSLGLLPGLASLAAAQVATPTAMVTVLPPEATMAGATLGQWSAQWWQWHVSFPVASHPGADETGARCGTGQHGPVFFLPALLTFDDITCVVPADTAIFVPIGAAECSTVEPPPFFGRDEAELRACARAAADTYSTLTASVDDHFITDLAQYRASSPLFTITLPDNNVLDAPAGVATAVAEGYDVLLAPLPAGEHQVLVQVVVEFEGRMLLGHQSLPADGRGTAGRGASGHARGRDAECDTDGLRGRASRGAAAPCVADVPEEVLVEPARTALLVTDA